MSNQFCGGELVDSKIGVEEIVNESYRHYLSLNEQLTPLLSEELKDRDIVLYQVKEITYEDKAPRKEALENVISSLQIEGLHFVYLIMGNKTGVRFYFGVARDLSSDRVLPLESVFEIGENVLYPSLCGNFRGSIVENVNESKPYVRSLISSMKYGCYFEGVPGIIEDNERYQSVDRLVDVMIGDTFCVMIVGKPLGIQDISRMEDEICDFYSNIAPRTKYNLQKGESTNKVSSSSNTQNASETTTDNESETTQKTEGKSTTKTKGNVWSEAKADTTYTSKGTTEAQNSSRSTNETGQTGFSKTITNGENDADANAEIQNESNSKSKGKTFAKMEGSTITTGESESTGCSDVKTTEFVDKKMQEWMTYLDEVVLKRLDYGKGKGIFVTSIALFTMKKSSLIKLDNTFKALYSGESGNKVPLKEFPLRKGDGMVESFFNFQVPRRYFSDNKGGNQLSLRTALAQFYTNESVCMGSWLSTNELSLIAGLPQKEIVGLGLREEVDFGLNIEKTEAQPTIQLGSLIQNGKKLDSIEVGIAVENLNKHLFITGVTGSGKTTTCHKILIDANLPFLVIEPAKSEYRVLNNEFDEILIFTLGVDTIAPFRLNPFEFFPHESITSRVDMIKASIEAAFEMEAAIPQIIEAAIYSCYADFGWDVNTNKNSKYSEPFADGVFSFPTWRDLINKIEEVVIQQGFDERLKKDYIGSIKARLQALTIGAKGLMLNTKRSIDFLDLLDKKVVLELEEIRNGSEKALIMGFVLSNLVEALKLKNKDGAGFKHITLIEEAHRLLSNYVPGDSLSKKQSVEMFADMLAEVRKYGESLIIVDQIPSKLTPDVLKNTNTKIVHKIFAQDDKEALGNTMLLSDEQKRFLACLDVGNAVVFSQGMKKAVQVGIKQLTNTNSIEPVKDDVIRKNALRYYCECHKRGIFPGLQSFNEKPTIEECETYMYFSRQQDLLEQYQLFFKHRKITKELYEIIFSMVGSYSKESVINYLLCLQNRAIALNNPEKTMQLLSLFLEDVLMQKISEENMRSYLIYLRI